MSDAFRHKERGEGTPTRLQPSTSICVSSMVHFLRAFFSGGAGLVRRRTLPRRSSEGEGRGKPVSSRNLKAGTSRSEAGVASETRRCLGPVTAEEDEEEEGKGVVKEKGDVCAVRVVVIGRGGMGMGWGGGGEGEWLYVMTEERKRGHVCRCGAVQWSGRETDESTLPFTVIHQHQQSENACWPRRAAHARLDSPFDFDFITRGLSLTDVFTGHPRSLLFSLPPFPLVPSPSLNEQEPGWVFAPFFQRSQTTYHRT
jgi:hypothetical protein